ncbi:MAG: hypothetical protein Q8Q26_15805 [Pseudorhodobacter sp.]|nr:hypothetical protein [Pseudorhodobacter sp.]
MGSVVQKNFVLPDGRIDVAAAVAEAHRLRAEALHVGVVAMGRWLKTRFGRHHGAQAPAHRV